MPTTGAEQALLSHHVLDAGSSASRCLLRMLAAQPVGCDCVAIHCTNYLPHHIRHSTMSAAFDSVSYAVLPCAVFAALLLGNYYHHCLVSCDTVSKSVSSRLHLSNI